MSKPSPLEACLDELFVHARARGVVIERWFGDTASASSFEAQARALSHALSAGGRGALDALAPGEIATEVERAGGVGALMAAESHVARRADAGGDSRGASAPTCDSLFPSGGPVGGLRADVLEVGSRDGVSRIQIAALSHNVRA